MSRVLLVYDVKGWAWYYRACDLQTFAPPQYTVDIVPIAEFNQWGPGRASKYDAVFNFSWTTCNIPLTRHAGRSVALLTCNGIAYDEMSEDNWDSWATTPSRRRSRAANRLRAFDGIIAVNERLAAEARSLGANVTLIPSGVNTDVFHPCRLRDREPRRDGSQLVVGWCGNPRGKRSVKGMEQILKPLMVRLGSDKFDWQINDRNHENAISRSNMSEWYRGLGVLICTSINEGTPSPVFEAASSGIAVLSTDVGMVTDWGTMREMKLIAPAYRNSSTAAVTIDWFERRLLELHANADMCHGLGLALNLECFRSFSYQEDIAKRYLECIAHG